MISLGIDIGGTGCKCVAFRETGEQIAMSYREYPTKPGEVNLNALTLRERLLNFCMANIHLIKINVL